MSDVIIIGFGNVGKNLKNELANLSPDVYDPFKGVDTREGSYRLALIAVDTPYVSCENPCDTSAVIDAIGEADADVYVIKSTVPVGFTEQLAEETGKRVVFSPEYYGTTQHASNFVMDFTVLGGRTEWCDVVQDALQDVYDARHRFIRVTSRVAEMAKYMENAWIATKVDFCIGFYEACENEGISYNDVRECFVADPRVSPCHTFVYREHPYWKSHCLDKDVPSIATQYGMEQLEQLIERNEKRVERYSQQ